MPLYMDEGKRLYLHATRAGLKLSERRDHDLEVKAYYYGFPWRQRVCTRVGFGAGFSMAQRVPLVELQDQARGGSNFLDAYVESTL